MYCNIGVQWLTFCHLLFNLVLLNCFTYKLGHDFFLPQPTFSFSKGISLILLYYVMSFSSLRKKMTACKELKEHLHIFSLLGSQLSSKLANVQQKINEVRNKLNAKLNIASLQVFCNKSLSPSNKSG